jgi:hypothetical protein
MYFGTGPPSRSTSPSPAVLPATLGSTETAPSTAAPAFLISRRALTRIREPSDFLTVANALTGLQDVVMRTWATALNLIN